ncbi:hypothetical protein [Kitasatospora sp. DSM 101779]|uniref:hypothetical protein n=1 Tax=Kitasatospora sp. DSM 101779 TaxID=2853165 RepID=UPI0021DB5315|nr:hypothetical protein [Kitasatospora sp. DSM 101779]MCU7820538.1 hypothetical protein [Kitasatospora sp. DSM 101779]
MFRAPAARDPAGVVLRLPALERIAWPLLAPAPAVLLWRAAGRREPAVLVGLAPAAAGDAALLVPGRAAFAAGTAASSACNAPA